MNSAENSMVEYYDRFEKWLKSNKEKKGNSKKKKGLHVCGRQSLVVLKHPDCIHAL